MKIKRRTYIPTKNKESRKREKKMYNDEKTARKAGRKEGSDSGGK